MVACYKISGPYWIIILRTTTILIEKRKRLLHMVFAIMENKILRIVFSVDTLRDSLFFRT